MREEVRAEQILCFSCKHLFSEESILTSHGCSAYPFGIPVVIQQGYVTHTEVFEGQEGEFVYEKKSNMP